MIRKILTLFGLGLAVATQGKALDLPKPYKEDSVNFMYNLLFWNNWGQIQIKN